ncbi:unnamed protein product, partial [Prorocentrum cordatum]
MQQWGVPDKIIRLIKNLHSKSWLSYGDLDTAIHVRLGGKQGCKYGNVAYSIGLLLLRDALIKAGVELSIHDPGPDFLFFGGGPADGDLAGNGEAGFVPPPSPDTAVPVIDVAFVDDECLLLCAKTPVKVPGSTDHVTVVPQCKHFGGVTEAGGSNVHEAWARVVSAAEAYSPLAVRVYGNEAYTASGRAIGCAKRCSDLANSLPSLTFAMHRQILCVSVSGSSAQRGQTALTASELDSTKCHSVIVLCISGLLHVLAVRASQPTPMSVARMRAAIKLPTEWLALLEGVENFFKDVRGE